MLEHLIKQPTLPEKAFFITGTDTGVGKTYCTVALLKAVQNMGYTAVGYKPIASGADEAGENEDVKMLQAASNPKFNYRRHNIYTFSEATAPHLAAVDERQVIEHERLSAGLAALTSAADCVLVEGAGGWLTPLDTQSTFADWVAQEKLPVVMVVGMKLGAINHALLTELAIRQKGLRVAGWIANSLSTQPHRLADYVATLTAMLSCPLLGVVPFGASCEQAANELSVNKLFNK